MSSNEIRKQTIENYIESYSNFDVENMLKDLDERIVFRNISGGAVDLETKGISDFRAQAEQAKNFFSQREQKITDLRFGENEVEAEILYQGTVAADLPNGWKAGDETEISGKSTFRFAGDKIILIEDVS